MNNKMESTARALSRLVLGLMLSLVIAIPAQAFEERELTKGYRIIVGFAHEDEEPPHANVPTGLTVFAGRDDPVTGETAVLDRRLGDTVTLTSVALLLETDDFNADVLKVIPMLKPFRLVEDEDIDPGYEQAFTPKKPGAYGFIVSGFLKKKGFAPTAFVQKFVCGRGNQDTFPDADFIRCVEP
jgi:hypothetical protein